MRLFMPWRRRAPHNNPPYNDTNDLAPAGSYAAATLGYIAAAALIFSAGAQNVAHAYNLGAARSEFVAVVLAIAAGGATLLAPLAFAAVGPAFRKWRIGRAVVALALGCGALTYSAVSSLGFVHGSRDLALSERVAAADTYGDRRALAKAARDELATLKGQRPDIVERRAELTAILAELSAGVGTAAKPAQPDSQAAALGFYLRAAGYKVDDASVGVWLSAGMVLFLELSAALSLTVAHAHTPIRVGSPPAAGEVGGSHLSPEPDAARPEPRQPRRRAKDDSKDDPPAPPPGKRGRKPTVLPQQAVERIRRAGGKINGSLADVGKALGAGSRTGAHRLLHRMAAAGLVQLDTGADGVRVALV